MSEKHPGPLVVEGKLTDAERMKLESNYLRGTIAEDLNDGLTGGFGDVVSQFSGLGSTLLDIFGGLQGPLSAAAAPRDAASLSSAGWGDYH
mgnify:CR=1 FL=1